MESSSQQFVTWSKILKYSLLKATECKRCILTNIDDPLIEFDQDGICNNCGEYDNSRAELDKISKDKSLVLNELVSKIKEEGKNNQYNCIIGLSGGVDSSYLAKKVVDLGLRPLAVHFDNGWNSELAVKNIEKIVTKLNIDLYTYVIDWPEFRDLQLAYFKASVIDIEAITDHAITSVLYQQASKNRVKYILNGNNIATESVLPKSWIHSKKDASNIVDIHNKYGTIPLKTYPLFGRKERKKYVGIQQIKNVSILDLIEYNYENVKKIIIDELDWKDYGGKHYESIFTRFYQGYILPNKFGVDKRKAHLSNLICSGQISKEEAKERLKQPIYDEQLLIRDRAFVLKKLGLNENEFEEIMKLPVRKHSDFKMDKSIYEEYQILKPLKPLVELTIKMLSK